MRTMVNEANPNWKGGITKIKEADEILSLSVKVQTMIRTRLLSQYRRTRRGCWNWTGSVFTTNGRARMILGKSHSMTAAKVSYVLHKGATKGLLVLHSCDNVLCVNPEHLRLGTNQDNSDDMVKRGRSLYQVESANHAAKLNETKVRRIKVLLKKGVKQNRLAREYGVCKQTIWFIAHNMMWSHV